MTRMLFSLFKDPDQTETAINKLEKFGFNPKELSLIMKDSSKARELSENTGANVVDNTITGATTGGLIGALLGLLVGVAVPGLGWLLVGGPIAAALGLSGAAAFTVSGALTGVLAGGLLGALTSLGVPEEDAKVYQQRIKEGAILLLVPVTGENELEAKDILSQYSEDEVKGVQINSKEKEEPSRRFEESPTYASEVRRNREDNVQENDSYLDETHVDKAKSILDEDEDV